MRRFPFLMSLVVGLIGCASEEDLLPCPPNGIGVEEFEGKSIGEQMEDYKKYACDQPQICPDQGGQAARQPLSPEVSPAEANFLLTNCSTGKEKLVIESIELYGDERCFFDPLSDADIRDKEILPGAETAMRTVYDPKQLGEDHAELRIKSNAQNYPLLKLRVCGIAVEPSTEEEPAAPDDDGGVGDGGVAEKDAAPKPGLECKAADKKNTQCH